MSRELERINVMPAGVTKILLLIFLIICAVTDVRTQRVSALCCVIFAMTGAGWNIYRIAVHETNISDCVLALLPGAVLLLLSVVTRQSIGAGDGICVLITGLYLDAMRTVMAVVSAFFLSALFSLVLLMLKKVKQNQDIPFVPFLAAGTLLELIS